MCMRLLFVFVFFIISFVNATSQIIVERPPRKYCYDKENNQLKSQDNNFHEKENLYEYKMRISSKILLNDSLKYCKWHFMNIDAKLHIDDSVILEINYFHGNTDNQIDFNDSVYIYDVSNFGYFRSLSEISSRKTNKRETDSLKTCNERTSTALNDFALNKSKNITGEIKMVEMNVKVKCSENQTDSIQTNSRLGGFDNYFSTGDIKTLKFQYPIVIVGECVKKLQNAED